MVVAMKKTFMSSLVGSLPLPKWGGGCAISRKTGLAGKVNDIKTRRQSPLLQLDQSHISYLVKYPFGIKLCQRFDVGVNNIWWRNDIPS